MPHPVPAVLLLNPLSFAGEFEPQAHGLGLFAVQERYQRSKATI